jgi:anti-sigma factor RsiW
MMARLRFRRRADLVCQQAVELVTDYLEGALSRREQARLEAHLRDCPHCTEYLDEMRATIAAAGRVDPGSLAPDVRDELVRLYRRWQEE